MLLCDFKKNYFSGTELPIIEDESHTYKARYNDAVLKRKPRKEKYMRSKRMSTARKVLDDGYNSDNSLLLANGDLKIDITPYIKHHLDSGYQTMPDGRGWYSSEKNDDRRTRSGWVQDLMDKQYKDRRRRGALKAVQKSLFRYRVDPYSWSQKPMYPKINGKVYGSSY